MSLLSSLKPNKGARSARKRKGRGESSGLGKTAGRGHKGQKARSSAGIPIGFEGGQMPLHRRSPKWGFNQRFRKLHWIVNLKDIETKFKSGEEVSPETLKAKSLVRNFTRPIKILGTGAIKSSFRFSAHAYSKAALENIKAAKGEATVLAWKEKKSTRLK
ncbi:MAG: 50S ribosomal protein L15 [Bradymonadales bacterium]|nr:MAG: 50S ribosomal protein L15 [Bradymonadales bacterium]